MSNCWYRWKNILNFRSAKNGQKIIVDLHLLVRKITIPFFYGRYLWITSLGTIIHSPQKLWQGLDMKRIAIISAETRNSKKEVFFSWQSALKTFSLSLIMVVRDEFFAINKVWFLAGVLCTAHLLCCCPVALYNSRFGKMKTSSLFLYFFHDVIWRFMHTVIIMQRISLYFYAILIHSTDFFIFLTRKLIRRSIFHNKILISRLKYIRNEQNPKS